MSLNDSKWLGAFALNPSLPGKSAAADGAPGVYLQLGVNPGYTVAPKSDYPLTISLPVTLGLSGSDYYEFGTTQNPTFGYVQFGPVFSVPWALSRRALAPGRSRAQPSSCSLAKR